MYPNCPGFWTLPGIPRYPKVSQGIPERQAIVKRLKQERMGFDNQLAGIERTLKADPGIAGAW